jgi:hypothetical protein
MLGLSQDLESRVYLFGSRVCMLGLSQDLETRVYLFGFRVDAPRQCRRRSTARRKGPEILERSGTSSPACLRKIHG